MDMSKEVEAGQAIYTPLVLATSYDLVVLGISNTFIWKCRTSRLLRMYDESISANHLDVGVGTGYFLANCRFPSPTPRLALMDLNSHSLRHAARRARRYKPECYQHDVLRPISLDVPKFDTIGMNYLLHCIPGSIEEKAVAFDHLRALLNPGGRFFGATILQGDAPRGPVAQRLMNLYNRKGVFHNQHDTLEGLERALKQRFSESHITLEGCVALFQART
jgi:ubiquinone/menaquinone biosynthesis C-methylase UbiE